MAESPVSTHNPKAGESPDTPTAQQQKHENCKQNKEVKGTQ